MVFFLRAVIKKIGNRISGMRPYPDRRRMIRKDQHSVVFAGNIQLIADDADDRTVDILDGLDLLFYGAHVPHLVRGFNMDIGKIISVFQQGFDRSLSLTFLIRLKSYCRAWNLNNPHSGSDPQPFQEVNSRNHDGLLPEFLFK